MKQLHYLAWNQWNHRNDTKHRTNQPRYKRMMKLLHREIIREHAGGIADLLPADRHHTQHNVVRLLTKSETYKKAWLVNITTARQRYNRVVQHNNDLTTLSKNTSKLLKWMKGHKF